MTMSSAGNAPIMYTTPSPYNEHHQNYLQMLGAYLQPSATGYKSIHVDPYFLSQGAYCAALKAVNDIFTHTLI